MVRVSGLKKQQERVQKTRKLLVVDEELDRCPFPGFRLVLRWWYWEGSSTSHAAVISVYDANEFLVLNEWYPNKMQARERTFSIEPEELWPVHYKYLMKEAKQWLNDSNQQSM